MRSCGASVCAPADAGRPRDGSRDKTRVAITSGARDRSVFIMAVALFHPVDSADSTAIAMPWVWRDSGGEYVIASKKLASDGIDEARRRGTVFALRARQDTRAGGVRTCRAPP